MDQEVTKGLDTIALIQSQNNLSQFQAPCAIISDTDPQIARDLEYLSARFPQSKYKLGDSNNTVSAPLLNPAHVE